MNAKSITFRSSVKLIVLLAYTGPLLIVVGMLSGGQLLDGFMGAEKKNNLLQDVLLMLGILFSAVGPFCAFWIALFRALRFSRTDTRYWLLVLVAVIPAVFVLKFLLGR